MGTTLDMRVNGERIAADQTARWVQHVHMARLTAPFRVERPLHPQRPLVARLHHAGNAIALGKPQI